MYCFKKFSFDNFKIEPFFLHALKKHGSEIQNSDLLKALKNSYTQL